MYLKFLKKIIGICGFKLVSKNLIKTERENAYTMVVPLDVELDIGKNWLEAH